MKSWLVNDKLSCIEGTRTFWNHLLDWFPDLEDKTDDYTPFSALPEKIERMAKKDSPDLIIRNATFFRRLVIPCRTISFLQDCYLGASRLQQLDVCSNSDVVVFNSHYTAHKYKILAPITRTEVIPIGTDFQMFHPMENKEELRQKWGIAPNSVLFVGANSNIKGFYKMEKLMDNTHFNICLVMKDRFRTSNRRVKVFNRITQEDLTEIMNACSFLLCTSQQETLHLAGIEAGACDIPVLTTNVGAYFTLEDGKWGRKIKDDEKMNRQIQKMLDDLDEFSPRECFFNEGLDKSSCEKKWRELYEDFDSNGD